MLDRLAHSIRDIRRDARPCGPARLDLSAFGSTARVRPGRIGPRAEDGGGRRAPGRPERRRGCRAALGKVWRAWPAAVTALGIGGAPVAAQAGPVGQGSPPAASRVEADTLPTGEPDLVPWLEVRPSDLWLGAVVLTPLALLEVLDGVDADLSPGRFTEDGFAHGVGKMFGDQFFGLGVTAGTFALGSLTGRERVRAAGLRTLEAFLVAKVATSTVKVAVGRQRPFVSRDSNELDPLSLDADQQSFPSGHTSQAFAIATALSDELSGEAPWLPFVAYPLATWTGITRVREGKHWGSDILAGAALGVLSAKWIGSARRAGPGGIVPSVEVGPAAGAGVGVLLGWHFD